MPNLDHNTAAPIMHTRMASIEAYAIWTGNPRARLLPRLRPRVCCCDGSTPSASNCSKEGASPIVGDTARRVAAPFICGSPFYSQSLVEAEFPNPVGVVLIRAGLAPLMLPATSTRTLKVRIYRTHGCNAK